LVISNYVALNNNLNRRQFGCRSTIFIFLYGLCPQIDERTINMDNFDYGISYKIANKLLIHTEVQYSIQMYETADFIGILE
jgi:hypothetical protein